MEQVSSTARSSPTRPPEDARSARRRCDQARRRSCAARPSRTRASSRCSTRWSTTCRRRSTCPPIDGQEPDNDEDEPRSRASPTTRSPSPRWPSRSRPTPTSASSPSSASTRARLEAARACSTRQRASTERIGRILMMHANEREEVDEVYAGDIAAAVGIKTRSPATRSATPKRRSCWRTIEFPEPVIEVAVEPKTKADQEKMAIALGRLAAGGPDVPRAHRRGDRPDRSSRAWASCTWRSSSTA